MSKLLRVEALTPAGFAPFGDVIEADAAATHCAVNAGTATRYHDLARIDKMPDSPVVDKRDPEIIGEASN